MPSLIRLDGDRATRGPVTRRSPEEAGLTPLVAGHLRGRDGAHDWRLVLPRASPPRRPRGGAGIEPAQRALSDAQQDFNVS